MSFSKYIQVFLFYPHLRETSKQLDSPSLGWRDGSAVKGTYYICRGPEFTSQQPFPDSQPLVSPAPGDPALSLASVGTALMWHADICAQVYTHVN